MSFLRAKWHNLLLFNFEVDPNILQRHVPAGTELDLWNDKCYVSLVGFMFLDTSILGVKVPFHINFEEVNLRFYVKRFAEGEWRRGVVFIKEIVPKHALTFVANTVYKEHYETLPMKHQWELSDEENSFRYSWKKAGNWNQLQVNTGSDKIDLEPNSEAEFITEHYWGYARINDQKTNEYQVTHPSWKIWPVKSYDFKVDFESNYGEEFSFLNSANPISVMAAVGSEITVESKTTLKF